MRINLKKVHYSWFVTAGCFIILMYSIGFTINLSSLLLTPLINHVGITKSLGSSIIGLQNFVGLLAMIIVGRLYVHLSIRKACLFFGVAISIGYFIFSFATSLSHCYVAAILIGAGYGGSSMIPVSILMTRWYHDKRGLALGFACLGTGLSTVIFSPIIGWILNNYGLPIAYRFIFVVVCVGVLISFLLIRDYPKDLALEKYGAATANQDDGYELLGKESEENGDSVYSALRSRRFYLVALSMFLLGITMTPTISHIGVHLSTNGYSTTFTSMMLAIYGGVMLIFKPFYGLIVDRFGGYLSNYYIYAVWIVGLLFSLFVGKSSIFAYLFSIFCGIGAPLGNMMPSIIIGEIFGLKSYTQLFSVNKVLFTLGASVGSIIPGVIADATGYYSGAFVIYLFIVVLSLIIVQHIMLKTGVDC